MGEPARTDDADALVELSYAEFGRRFFTAAVTTERVTEAIADLAGRPIDVGPIGVGPLRLVKVRANGAIGTPVVQPRDDPQHVAYRIVIPAQLTMEIQIGLESYRFAADTAINLSVTARPVAPVRIFIDVTPPRSRDIDVDLAADGLGASVLEKLAGVEREVRRNVAGFVRTEIDKSRDRRLIDLARAADKT
jgi:hypothetical protein